MRPASPFRILVALNRPTQQGALTRICVTEVCPAREPHVNQTDRLVDARALGTSKSRSDENALLGVRTAVVLHGTRRLDSAWPFWRPRGSRASGSLSGGNFPRGHERGLHLSHKEWGP